jgi:hypothetical protein
MNHGPSPDRRQAAIDFILRRYHDDAFTFSPVREVANTYSTSFAVLGLELLGALPRLTEDQRRRVAVNMMRQQRADTGLFSDPTLVPRKSTGHDLTYVEHQQTDFALLALDALGAAPLNELLFVEPYEAEHPARWLAHLDWTDPWLASNRIMFMLNFLLHRAARGAVRARARVDEILEWLDAHQDGSNGLWNLGHRVSMVNQMAGAYHFLFFYTYVGRRPRHLRRIIDVCLRIQDTDGLFAYAGGGGSCEDLDAVDLLCRCWSATHHRTRSVRASLRRAHRALWANQNADGGFCWAKRDRLSLRKLLRVVRPSLLAVSWSELRDNARDKLANQRNVLLHPARLTWAYSGLESLRIPLSASDLWSTWFRLLAIAMIESTMPELAQPHPAPWRLPCRPGLGFFR